MGLVGNSWSVDWSDEIKTQRSGPGAATSRFFGGRCQLDDLIFGGLADDVFSGKQGLRKEREMTTKLEFKHKNNKGRVLHPYFSIFEHNVTIKPHFLMVYFSTHCIYILFLSA